MKIFEPDGSEWSISASGAAWGDGEHGPYGTDYPIAPGHYQLPGTVERFAPIASEGSGQIDVGDLWPSALKALLDSGKARQIADSQGNSNYPLYDVGGVLARVGGLARYGRSAIMIHGGGSNAPDPLAPQQELCRTEGCTRVHNADWPRLAAAVEKYRDSHTIVFTALGDPKDVSC